MKANLIKLIIALTVVGLPAGYFIASKPKDAPEPTYSSYSAPIKNDAPTPVKPSAKAPTTYYSATTYAPTYSKPYNYEMSPAPEPNLPYQNYQYNNQPNPTWNPSTTPVQSYPKNPCAYC